MTIPFVNPNANQSDHELIEVIPSQLVDSWRQGRLFMVNLLAVVSAVALLPCLVVLSLLALRGLAGPALGIGLGLAGAAVILVWLLLWLGLRAFVRCSWQTSKFPVVRCRGNTLTLTWGHTVVTAQINKCHFRTGKAWQRSRRRMFKRPLPFGVRDLVLIDFPPLQRDLFGRVYSKLTAPVGYTPESFVQWKAALGLEIGEPVDERIPDKQWGTR